MSGDGEHSMRPTTRRSRRLPSMQRALRADKASNTSASTVILETMRTAAVSLFGKLCLMFKSTDSKTTKAQHLLR